MTGWFIFMFWLGGVGEMYSRARRQGTGWFTATIDGLAWPWEIGKYLAEHYTETYEEGLEKENARNR